MTGGQKPSSGRNRKVPQPRSVNGAKNSVKQAWGRMLKLRDGAEEKISNCHRQGCAASPEKLPQKVLYSYKAALMDLLPSCRSKQIGVERTKERGLLKNHQ